MSATSSKQAKSRHREDFACGGVVVRGREIAVIKPTGKQDVCLPKGHVDGDESNEQAALREIREETGITATISEPLGEIEYTFGRKQHVVHKRVVFFLCEYVEGDVADHDHEVDEAFWLDIDAATRELTFEAEREIVRSALAKV